MVAKLRKVLKIIFLLLIVFGIIWISGIEIFLCEIPVVNGMVVLLFNGFLSILTIYLLELALLIEKNKLLRYSVGFLTMFLVLFVHMFILANLIVYQFKTLNTELVISDGNFDKEIIVAERHIAMFTNGSLYTKIAPGIWKYEDCFGGCILFPISSGNYTAWYDDVEKCLYIKAVFWNGEDEEVYRFQIP